MSNRIIFNWTDTGREDYLVLDIKNVFIASYIKKHNKCGFLQSSFLYLQHYDRITANGETIHMYRGLDSSEYLVTEWTADKYQIETEIQLRRKFLDVKYGKHL